jgi:hypothetical protein
VIVQPVVHTEIETRVQVPVRLPIVVIAQQVAPTVIVTPVRHRVQVQIVASAVTVRAIHVQVLVRLRIAESAVTVQEIHDHLQIVPIVRHVAQRVDRQIDAIALRHVATQIVQPVVPMETVTHVQVPIVHAEATRTVAIVHALAMIAMPVHHAMIVAVRVTANAVADQIVPEVASPMIAKSVHAVALAKSA